MIKLIGLEFKRVNILPFIYGVMVIFIFSFGIGLLFAAVPKIENNISQHILADLDTLSILITIISMSAFTILASVMYSKFLVEEYTTKKNIMIFSYPQKRSNIFFAKYILVTVFTFVSMVISNFVCILLVGYFGNLIGIMSSSFKDFSFIAIISILFAVVGSLISLISLRVGFWKKSIIATIITSVILVAPIGNSLMLLKDNLMIILPLLILLLFVGISIYLGLLKKINNMEVE